MKYSFNEAVTMQNIVWVENIAKKQKQFKDINHKLMAMEKAVFLHINFWYYSEIY